MPDTPLLTIAYIESWPESAARNLETLAPEDAAALIATLPGRVAVLALARMSPWSAAQCLEGMAAARGANVVREMLFQDAAAVLRLTSKACRGAILDALPATTARTFEHSLAFPSGTVGAHMDSLAPSMAATRTVGDALKYARQKKRPRGDQIFITDTRRTYLGIVRISELFRHDAKTELGGLIDDKVDALLARANLASVEHASQWVNHTILPVVGRKGNFLGTLSRQILLAATGSISIDPQTLGNSAVLPHLLTGYAVTLIGLAKMMLQGSGETRRAETQDDR